MTQEEKARAYDEVVNKLRRFMAQGVEPLITRADVQDFFPELAESEDEKIRKWLIGYFQRNKVAEVIKTHDILAWLEKQGEKEPAEWSEKDENMLKSIIATCELAEQDRDSSPAKHLLEMQTNWLKSLKQRILDNSAKIGKNDTLLDLFHKMPTYITVDGIIYHFILRKTALAYTAYYAGEEEGEGKVIFVMTAFSPIDLLTDMLEELKEKGLLENQKENNFEKR